MNLYYHFNISKNSAGKAKGRLRVWLEHSCICGQAFPFSSLFSSSKNFILSLVFFFGLHVTALAMAYVQF